MNKILVSFILCCFIITTLPVSVIAQNSDESIHVYERVKLPKNVEFVPNEIIVKFKPGVSHENIKAINDRHGTSEIYTSPFAGFKRLRIPNGKTVPEMVEIFAKNPNVEYAEPNSNAYEFSIPNDPLYSYQWHLDDSFVPNPYGGTNGGGINIDPARAITNGSRVIVAVLDTGVAYENYGIYMIAPDLANTNFVQGYDFVNGDIHPNDDNAHGTHVAGTIAQSTNNRLGVAGVAPGSSIMPVKVLDNNGEGTLAWLVDGIYYATNHNAKVISMSLGWPPGYFPGVSLTDALDYAYNNGVTCVAAAGNDGRNIVSYPAAYDTCIAVGATRYDETKPRYSNYGSALDISAPGGDTGIDQNSDTYGDGVLQNTFNPNTKNPADFSYWFFDGTSMATPHVSGVAALLISKGIATTGVATTPDDVRAALQSTAEDKGTPGWDNTYGWGIVDAAAALAYASGPIDNPPSVSITNPSDGATVSGTLDITAEASDDVGVVQVDFYYGTTLIGSDTTSPYSVSWDSRTVADGSYTLTAKVTDSVPHQTSDSISVLVDNVNEPPIANAGIDRSAFIGNTINFDASGSSDPDGTIVSYDWNFGDSYTGTGVTTSHIYTVAGTYTVTLTVTDNDGSSSIDTATVIVNVAPSEVTVFSDSFEINEWNGNWTEDRQNDWLRSNQRAFNGIFSAEVDGSASNAKLTSIPINLQGRTNATIIFSWYIESSLDSGEYIAFDVSTNGGTTWVEKALLKGNVDTEDVWHPASIDLTGINNLRIQFRGSMNRNDEDADVDMVQVIAR